MPCLPVRKSGLETGFRLQAKEVQMKKHILLDVALRGNEAWRCFRCVTVGLNFFFTASNGTVIDDITT